MKQQNKTKRVDLWLNQADLALLDELTVKYTTSKQRMIESALSYISALKTPIKPQPSYVRHGRVILNLDGLASIQLEELAQCSNISYQGVLRGALQAFEIAL